MSLFRQLGGQPLFPDLLWSRPENKRYAGKLLIIGGNSHNLSAPARAFAAAQAAGIGKARVILPDSVQKLLGRSFSEAEFAPSTPSGSFAQSSLALLLEAAGWADGVLLAGDFGKNSETALLLEKLLDKSAGQITISGDGVDYFLSANSPLFSRQGILTVTDFSRLQKAAKFNRPQPALLHNMDIIKLAETVNGWTNGKNIGFLTEHQEKIVVSWAGKASLTDESSPDWVISLAAYAAVWRLQQPDKPLEAITTAVYELINTDSKPEI